VSAAPARGSRPALRAPTALGQVDEERAAILRIAHPFDLRLLKQGRSTIHILPAEYARLALLMPRDAGSAQISQSCVLLSATAAGSVRAGRS
jgi:hypothetical protein